MKSFIENDSHRGGGLARRHVRVAMLTGLTSTLPRAFHSVNGGGPASVGSGLLRRCGNNYLLMLRSSARAVTPARRVRSSLSSGRSFEAVEFSRSPRNPLEINRTIAESQSERRKEFSAPDAPDHFLPRLRRRSVVASDALPGVRDRAAENVARGILTRRRRTPTRELSSAASLDGAAGAAAPGRPTPGESSALPAAGPSSSNIFLPRLRASDTARGFVLPSVRSGLACGTRDAAKLSSDTTGGGASPARGGSLVLAAQSERATLDHHSGGRRRVHHSGFLLLS